MILSVEDEVGQRVIIDDLLEATRGADPGLRRAAITILNGYFARTRLDYSAHTRTLLSGLIRLLNDANPEVLLQSWDTISSITKVRQFGLMAWSGMTLGLTCRTSGRLGTATDRAAPQNEGPWRMGCQKVVTVRVGEAGTRFSVGVYTCCRKSFPCCPSGSTAYLSPHTRAQCRSGTAMMSLVSDQIGYALHRFSSMNTVFLIEI